MAEYLTTKDVARYLKLNEKKVYALVKDGKLPAARISGKWIFPKHLVDQWIEKNTVYPRSSVMGALIDEVLIVIGSDDWLFGQVTERFYLEHGIPVACAEVGSLAGLSAVAAGKSHLAGFHVDNHLAETHLGAQRPCYLIGLVERCQGLIYDRQRVPGLRDLRTVVADGLRFALRQPLSGTHRLVQRHCAQMGLKTDELRGVGPFSSHLELAVAVRKGRADVGVGIQVAADLCGLDFVPLETESFKLALPTDLAAHPRMVRFLDIVLSELNSVRHRSPPTGYQFVCTGRIETVGTSVSP